MSFRVFKTKSKTEPKIQSNIDRISKIFKENARKNNKHLLKNGYATIIKGKEADHVFYLCNNCITGWILVK